MSILGGGWGTNFYSLNILFEIYFSIIFIIVSRNIISTQVCAQIQHSASEYCMFNGGGYWNDTNYSGKLGCLLLCDLSYKIACYEKTRQ